MCMKEMANLKSLVSNQEKSRERLMIEISHLGHSLRLKEHRTILAYQMGFLVVCYLCPKTPILANG